MSDLIGINSKDRKLVTMVLEAELQRVKTTATHTNHVTAIEFYKKHLIALLKKLNPRERYW